MIRAANLESIDRNLARPSTGTTEDGTGGAEPMEIGSMRGYGYSGSYPRPPRFPNRPYTPAPSYTSAANMFGRGIPRMWRPPQGKPWQQPNMPGTNNNVPPQPHQHTSTATGFRQQRYNHPYGGYRQTYDRRPRYGNWHGPPSPANRNSFTPTSPSPRYAAGARPTQNWRDKRPEHRKGRYAVQNVEKDANEPDTTFLPTDTDKDSGANATEVESSQQEQLYDDVPEYGNEEDDYYWDDPNYGEQYFDVPNDHPYNQDYFLE